MKRMRTRNGAALAFEPSAPASDPAAAPVASVVIPAHNEEGVIGDLLRGLVVDDPFRFEVIVVCNGCTDDTARVAGEFPNVQVVDIPEPSKRVALARGDDAATVFPRLYVDADVRISAQSVEMLVAALHEPATHAAGPVRVIRRDGVSRWVSWYYDVWERLPQVREGLFGRGVIAVSRDGNDRIRALPALMGDDLASSEAFAEHERRVVDGSQVIIWPPKTIGDLVRRRVRAATGNAEADRAGVRRPASITSLGTLVGVSRSTPRLIIKLPLFVAIAVVSRVLAYKAVRAGNTTTWLRDDSSREGRSTA